MVTPRMGGVLRGLQDQVERSLTGQILQRKTDGNWYHTLAATARGWGGVPEDGGVHSATTEHSRTLHRYMITDRPV